jgi:ABC-type amino acid transport substrate-binding protein
MTRQRLVFDQTVRFESIFKALLLGRVDAVYCNRATMEHILTRLGKPTSVVAWSTTLPRFTSEFHISSPHRELIDDFNRWLHGHREWIVATQISYGVAPRSPEENGAGVPPVFDGQP